ncbi:MAG: hypothetical protein ABI205_12495 [Gemmatimonadaceae bacterium]
MTSRGTLVSLVFCALASTAAPAGAQTAGVWKVDSLRGKAGAGHTALLTIHSEEPIDGWPGGFVPTLGIKCVDHVRSIFVVTGLPTKPEAGKDRHFSIFYRLNDDSRIDEVWGQATNSDTLVASDPAALAQKLLKYERLRFGFTPDHSSRMILEFPLAGLDKAMTKVPAQCGSPR